MTRLKEPLRPLGYSVKDTSQMLRCSRTQVYNLINRGVLKSFKVGGSRRVLTESLDDLIAEQVGE